MKISISDVATLVVMLVLPAAVLRADDDKPRLFPSHGTIVQPYAVLSFVAQPNVREDLKLSDEQQKQIQQMLADTQEATRRVDGTGRQPELDAATAKDLEAVLTDAQREKLGLVLGEPAKCLDEPLRPSRWAR